MEITLCTSADLDDWTQLRVALWPDYPAPELRAGAAAMLDEAGEGVALICRVNGQPAGFAEGSLRRDYVNGCETSPVAFLEGIYVVPAHRNKGVAEALVERVARVHKELCRAAGIEAGVKTAKEAPQTQEA